MADSTPLPQGWSPDYEGTIGATYRREPTGIELVIEPRYTVDRNHQRTPTSFRVRLKRPFWLGQGDHVQFPLKTVDTFADAKVLAREYMKTYNERYRQTHDQGDAIRGSDGKRADRSTAAVVAAQTAAELVIDSFDDIVDQVRTLIGDGLLAVWTVDAGSVEMHYDEGTFDRDRAAVVTEAVAALDASSLSAELDDDIVCVSVTLEESVVYRFLSRDAPEIVIVIDETSRRVEPNFTRVVTAMFTDLGS